MIVCWDYGVVERDCHGCLFLSYVPIILREKIDRANRRGTIWRVSAFSCIDGGDHCSALLSLKIKIKHESTRQGFGDCLRPVRTLYRQGDRLRLARKHHVGDMGPTGELQR